MNKDHKGKKPFEGRKPFENKKNFGDKKPYGKKPGEGFRKEGKPFDKKPGEGFRKEGKPFDKKPGEGFRKEGKPFDKKPGEGFRKEGRPFDKKPGEGFRKEGKPFDKKPAFSKTAREVALKALQDVVRGDAYASQALDRQLGSADLKEEDRRLAASLFYFAVENRLYIEYVLDSFMESRPEPVINDILHIAAAQLLFMDKIPDHAAVDEAVKQVRAYKREGFTGLVNGVLRNLIRTRDEGGIRLPEKEEDPEKYLSVRYSIAPGVVRRLVEAFGFEDAEAICAYRPEGHTQTIRRNLMRMDAQAFEAYLDKNEIKWEKGRVPDSYIISGAGSLAMHEGYKTGEFSIQGESSMLAAQAMCVKPGMQVLDACAAPGGKTCLMAETMRGTGRVFAWDVHEHRVDLIRAAARRLGLENVRTTVRDARKPFDSAELTMDAVLVDAPCSGLGVIADKPDIKYRQSEESLTALPPLQAQILEACAKTVKVGGLLVYSTCTIMPDENEHRVRAFLKDHPEFEPETDDKWLPEDLKPLLKDGMLQILPNRDGLEGFFIARMRRKGV